MEVSLQILNRDLFSLVSILYVNFEQKALCLFFFSQLWRACIDFAFVNAFVIVMEYYLKVKCFGDTI